VARWNTGGRVTCTCCIESDVFAIESAICHLRSALLPATPRW
jgi:hypothetical protein